MPENLTLLLRRPERWLPALLGVVYVVAWSSFSRVRASYEMDPDEGFNLMKIMLLGRGHALHEDVWSDQPPGYTYLGLLFVRIFGEDVESVRCLTTVLTGVMVFAIADLLRRSLPGFAGLFAGVAAALILPAAGSLARYSVAAMIGLPSIALSVAALWALVVSRSRRPPWLVAAGALFAGSLVIKLFTAFLLPVLALLLCFQARDEAPGRRVKAVLRASLWVACGFVPLLALGLSPAFSEQGVAQLYGTHVDDGVVKRPQYGLLLRYLERDSWVYALALLGLVLAIRRRSLIGSAFGAFLLLSLAVTATHSPLWYHHVLLVSVPASVLAALAVGYALELMARRLRGVARVLGFCAVVAGLAVIARPLVVQRTPAHVRKAEREQELAVDRAIRRHAPHAQLMVTARQIRAFRLGIPVSPELAVTSQKRFVSGQLSAGRIRAIIERDRPDVVIIDERWPASVRRTLKRFVEGGYQLVFEQKRGSGAAVFVRNGAGKPGG